MKHKVWLNLAGGLAAAALLVTLASCQKSREQPPAELTQLLSRPVSHEEVYAQHLSYARRAAGMEPLNRIFYLDLKTFLPCLNLAYADGHVKWLKGQNIKPAMWTLNDD